ncbi:cuticle protein 16.5 [Parasteatoda tepidariorum]|uniref:cuticle protein 16.5 n=1 Tax=Parasteatoda tepidariorum TaxID=114398 RepID=UPI00077FB9CB|nr:uncharacterized protein LOC107456438 [Parasteatoda tepidariorum]
MMLKACILLVVAALAVAAPAKSKSDDLEASEGRHVPTYSASYGSPIAYAAPAPKYGGAQVTSYSRRGSYAHGSDFAKPSIYGSSYKAEPSIRAPAYSAEPSYHGSLHGYASAPSVYPAAPSVAYGAYGPQTNAYSAHSQIQSQDPSYDAAKDPVSQYAAYIPAKEYAKGQSIGNELSIYGY